MTAASVSPIRMRPGRLWRVVRAAAQSLAWIALLATPLIGGWQRADAASLSAWRAPASWDLAPALTDVLGTAQEGEEAWDKDVLLGGGMGVEYFGVPIVDPVAGLMGALRAVPSLKGAIALALPLLLALLMGRMFCGWFCPFGFLSRFLARALLLLPHPPRRYELGPRRWVRWVVLAACLVGGALGSQLVVTLALPHLVLAQSVFSLWLLGGGGAILGWLIGLVLAGLWLGPGTYCATVCPTGALFALFGRFRLLRLRIEDPSACGSACRRCDLACWLQLSPASGDAGADCDGCLRCAAVCPHDSLRVGVGRGAKKTLPVLASLALLVVTGSANAQGADPYIKPALTLDAHTEHQGVNVAVGVLDMSKVRLNADTATTVGGSEITVRLVRGERAPDDERGRQGAREHFAGELSVEVWRDGGRLAEASWPAPNAPRSTVNRKLYMKRIDEVIAPGDEVRVLPAAGWTKTPAVFVVAEPSSGAATGELLWFLLAGLLVNAGLLAIAIVVAQTGPPPASSGRRVSAAPSD